MMEWCKSKCPKWPITRKCCFCVPIRKGLTIFGYVNLALSLLSVPLLVFHIVELFTSQRPEEKTLRDSIPQVPVTVIFAFVVIDVVMAVVLLIGAHRKKQLLLKIYLYFGVVIQLVSLCTDLTFFDHRQYVLNTLYLLFLGLNIYLLFLVYNTIHLLEESAAVRYVTYREPKR